MPSESISNMSPDPDELPPRWLFFIMFVDCPLCGLLATYPPSKRILLLLLLLLMMMNCFPPPPSPPFSCQVKTRNTLAITRMSSKAISCKYTYIIQMYKSVYARVFHENAPQFRHTPISPPALSIHPIHPLKLSLRFGFYTD